MRVLHVVTRLDPRATRALEHLAGEERAAGYEVVIVSVGLGPVAGGVLTHSRPDVQQTWGLRYDVYHAHESAAIIATRARLSGSRSRSPLLGTLHDWMVDGDHALAPRLLEAAEACDRVVVPASRAAAGLIEHAVDPGRVRVIPYPVDPTPEPDPAALPLLQEMVDWRNRGGDVICAIAHRGVGAFHQTVVEAVSTLAHRHATLCVLAGEGDDRRSLQAARDLGVAEHVRVCGPPTGARAIAARADVAILPGFNERRPFALAEVWCDGVAVVAGRNAQFADLDAHGGGTLFYDQGDPVDLARAIATVRSTTPAGRRLLIDRARELYRRRFTPHAAFHAYAEEYAALIRGHRSVA